MKTKFKRKTMLGFNSNAKTIKGNTIGYYTGILYQMHAIGSLEETQKRWIPLPPNGEKVVTTLS